MFVRVFSFLFFFSVRLVSLPVHYFKINFESNCMNISVSECVFACISALKFFYPPFVFSLCAFLWHFFHHNFLSDHFRLRFHRFVFFLYILFIYLLRLYIHVYLFPFTAALCLPPIFSWCSSINVPVPAPTVYIVAQS